MKKEFCLNCGKFIDHEVRCRDVKITTPKGEKFKCMEFYVICVECENEIYIPEINDANVELRERTFKKIESEQTCPHCHPPFKHFGKYYIKTGYPQDTSLHVLRRDDALGGVMIEYCPICGRKLEE